MHKYKLRQVPRFFGTNWCAIVVPIQVIRWYRQCYDGTDSCAIVVQIRRYCPYRLSCLQRCISFESYIKPQRERCPGTYRWVVYLLNPTSNHNSSHGWSMLTRLYIFWILHQTTTSSAPTTHRRQLYIFWILHQTTTLLELLLFPCCCISFESYIKPQPCCETKYIVLCCISFESYIKPQLKCPAYWENRCCISFESYIKPQPLPWDPPL